MKFIQEFTRDYLTIFATLWGLTEGATYFTGEYLRGTVGNYWFPLFYGLPLIIAVASILLRKSNEDSLETKYWISASLNTILQLLTLFVVLVFFILVGALAVAISQNSLDTITPEQGRGALIAGFIALVVFIVNKRQSKRVRELREAVEQKEYLLDDLHKLRLEKGILKDQIFGPLIWEKPHEEDWLNLTRRIAFIKQELRKQGEVVDDSPIDSEPLPTLSYKEHLRRGFRRLMTTISVFVFAYGAAANLSPTVHTAASNILDQFKVEPVPAPPIPTPTPSPSVLTTTPSTPVSQNNGTPVAPPTPASFSPLAGIPSDTPVIGYRFGLDGSYIVITQDDGYFLWDLTNDQIIDTVYDGFPANDPFNADGTRFLTIEVEDSPSAKLWDFETGSLIMETEVFQFATGGSVAQFSPNGQQLITFGPSEAGSFDSPYFVNIWNSETGDLISRIEFEGIANPLNTILQINNDGTRLLVSEARGLLLWDIEANEEVAILQGVVGQPDFSSASFSPDGEKIVTAFAGQNLNSVALWNATTGEQIAILMMLSRVGDGNDPGLRWSPDSSRLITYSSCITYEETVRVWDTDTGALISELDSCGPTDSFGEYINTAFFDPTGNYIVMIGPENLLRFWEHNTGELLTTIEVPSLCSFVRTDSWRYTNFSPDGSKFVTTDGRGFNNACIWDVETGELLAVFEEASLAKFHPNGNLVVVSDELEVQIWQQIDE